MKAGIEPPGITSKANRLAQEQAALRRVATLVASSAEPEQVFQAVAEEAGRLLAARTAATVRFDEDSAVIVGSWSDGEGAGIEVGTLVPYSDPESPVYRVSREGGRIDDYADVPGDAARLTRLAGYRSSVAAPITAGGRLWGALFVFSASADHFPPDAQQRLADFTNLVALALESAEAHDQLTASRARIVEASAAERRRLERNLHDGAQQRLVTLAVRLRIAQECLREDPAAAEVMLADVGDELKLALAELRELARGLHPAVLTDRGLEPALQSLANRAPFPVEVVGVPSLRLDEGVEAAIYYLVAESLTNAVKHANASEARVEVEATDAQVVVAICDNGSDRRASRRCDLRQRKRRRGHGPRVRAPRARRPHRGPRWSVRARESFRGRNRRASRASSPLTSSLELLGAPMTSGTAAFWVLAPVAILQS